MSLIQRTLTYAGVLGLLFGSPNLARATAIYGISMNTSPLIGHSAGPFSLEFQLNDGTGSGDANNIAILSNFLFGGGSASGIPSLTGGASGNLSSTIHLTDSSFFNQFIQGFTPGNTLSFQLFLTSNVDSGGTPDQFSFAILDRTGTEIPTLAGSFFDVLVEIDIDSTNPLVHTFASDTARSPAGGGGSINIAAPQVTPEPGTLALLGCGMVAGLGLWKFRRVTQRRI